MGVTCLNRVESMISGLVQVIEHGSPLSPKVEAARQVIVALGNAQNYWVWKQRKGDTFGDKETQQLANLSKMFDSVHASNTDPLTDLGTRVQGLIASLFMPRWFPSCVGLVPSYTALIQGEVEISFLGRFLYADRAVYENKYQPYLKINKTTIPADTGRQDRLGFRVKGSQIYNQISDKSLLIKAELVVPYENGKVFGERRTAEFPLWIGLLPLKPALNLTLHYKWMEPADGSPIFCTSPFTSLGGKQQEGNANPPTEGRTTFKASEGCRIDKKSTKLIKDPNNTAQGKAYIENTTDTEINVKLSLEEGSKGTFGVRVTYDEIPRIKVGNESSEAVEIAWGKQIELDEAKNYEVEFVDTNGMRYCITDIDQSKPYIEVVEKSGKLFLEAVPPNP